MNQRPLFRPEVRQAQAHSLFGDVFINTPQSYWVTTIGAGVIFGATLLVLCYAKLTEQCEVRGYLTSDQGIMNLYPYESGVILKRYPSLGAHVKKNEPLFLIETRRHGLGEQNRDPQLDLYHQNQQSIAQELADKQREIKAFKQLLQQKLISSIDYTKKNQELLLIQQKNHQILGKIAQHQASGAYLVRAPKEGVISNLLHDSGQWVEPSKPLATLIPQHSQFIAKIYVPVSDARFLRVKAPLHIHLDAYPSQAFGDMKAQIQHISQSTLTDEQENKPFNIGQAYYTITARLKKPRRRGQESSPAPPLHYGMTLSARLQGERKTVWQWLYQQRT